MKKQFLISLLAGCALSLAAPGVLANNLPANAVSMATVLQNLQAAGYVAIQEVKFDDGVYKAEVINPQGIEVKVSLDAQTGKVVEPASMPKMISISDAVKKVEAAGYTSISKVEADKGKYEVKALDKEGKKARLDVNAMNGEITKKMFD